jgi:multimeric flavodoxin WrbA
MKVLVVFYSMYGHVYRLAEAVAEGAREVAGADVFLRRVPETLAGTQGERKPSENELAAARFQGRHVATIAAKLIG